LIWMPPGLQEEVVSCCEEVGCVLISGLDCAACLVSQLAAAGPDAYPLTSASSPKRTFYVRSIMQVWLVPV
ncbi:hypothetical protein, partial [Variovorax sp. GT1P44]|uniref:hypothetical protein n=1 Tax=Variovorax sp. GT1P44 TaxID=3443742 RepID=UPI003F45D81A